MKWIKDRFGIKRYKVDKNDNLVAKLCSKCDRILLAKDFSPDKNKPYGVTPGCRDCRNAVHRKTYRTKIKDPEYVQRHRDINNKHRKNYSKERKRELIEDWKRRYHEDEVARQKHLDLTKKWYETKKGKERSAIVRHTRRTRMGKIDSKLTRGVIQTVEDASVRTYGELTCEYCKVPIWMTRETYHLDHIVPICNGGNNNENNLNITCCFCNSIKGSKSLEAFLQSNWLKKRKKEVRELRKSRKLRLV